MRSFDLFDANDRLGWMFVFENKIYVVADFKAVEQRLVLDIKFHDHWRHNTGDLFMVELNGAKPGINLSDLAFARIIAVFRLR